MNNIKAQAILFVVTFLIGLLTGSILQDENLIKNWQDNFGTLFGFILIPALYTFIPVLLAKKNNRTTIADMSLKFWYWGHIVSLSGGVITSFFA